MVALFADRFVYREISHSSGGDGVVSVAALDLATNGDVRLRISTAGSRAEQAVWMETCVKAHARGELIDYGFIGKDRRFEATPLGEVNTLAPRQPAPTHLLEWLEGEHPGSPRILRVPHLPDPHEIRARGFVTIQVARLNDPTLMTLWPLLRGRSVALLDHVCDPEALGLALLKLRRAGAHNASGLMLQAASGGAGAMAAEARAVYDARPFRDARPATMLAEGDRLLAKGRHAAAERALRAAIAAFDRRGDPVHAARSELTLGGLLLNRGRAADALTWFERAHDRFQRARAVRPAIDATVHAGLAQTDLGLFRDAERSCRAAYSASSAVKDTDASAASAICLSRVLFWQDRYGEARDLLESLTPPSDAHAAARYWCLVARLRLTARGFREARAALACARTGAHPSQPATESLVRRWEAVVQAQLGDVEALEFHVRAGLEAARAAHLPLQAVRLRLALTEGLIDAGRLARARAIAARLHGLSRSTIPPLLKTQIARVLARANAPEDGAAPRRPIASAREAVATFHPGASTTAQDLEALSNLLSASRQEEHESKALARAVAIVRKHTHAVAVGIYGAVGAEPRLLGSSGTPTVLLAARACQSGIAIGPERTTGGVEAAAPIRYLGRLVGALSVRWNVEGPIHAEHAAAFCGAVAAVCAPVMYVLLERQSAPTPAAADSELIGVSAAIDAVRRAIHRAANAPFPVLVEGESGSGKELVARAIHRTGARRERPFCAFNCAAMPEELVDAELFGHAKGAFTGATGERQGLFESADGGTVFLDEVGELSARAQAKVLRALQEGEVRRVGENFTRPFDARLVAATNRSLRTEVESGRFRQDLLYRLDVIRISMPPLRDRVDDIPVLAARFWRACADRTGSKAVLGRSVVAALARYHWPGNVRELQNVLAALVVAAPSRGVVGASHLPAAIARVADAAPHQSLERARREFEQRFVSAALAQAAGHRGRAAAALGISRQGLAKLLQRLRLDGQRVL